ncbi:MAG: M20 family metallopeptidase [bacterium]|nr:M20 family metallopeptidase [bacterium]
MNYTDMTALADAMRDELIDRRRDLHRHPETAFEEVRTAGIVAQTLSALGLEVRTGVGKTGVIGLLEGAHDGPTVLVRADMDALPIQEENAFAYASQVGGKMHACGHDAHTSIVLGVAKILAAQRDHLAGRVKFVFQPAEEIGRGALAMVDDGALTDPRPDVTLGLHVWNSLPFRTLGVATGPVMAGASTFTVQVTGKGGHAASPHAAVDPVVCASHIVTMLQSIVSRNVNPFDTAVISVTSVRAGEAYNVIPQTAEMRGTIRTFSLEVRDQVENRMRDIIDGCASAMDCAVSVEFTHLTKPVINDETVTLRAREVFLKVDPTLALDTSARTMGSEDVSEFMMDVPGLFFFVGAADATQNTYYGHHHPRFSIDEAALPLGVALLSAAVADYLVNGA